MKKIVFYINGINGGGAARVMVNLAGQLSEGGYNVILVTSFRDDWEYDLSKSVKRITLENVEIKQSVMKRNVSRILKLRKVCKSEKPDVLISFITEPTIRALVAAAGLPVKNIISVRSDPKREYSGILSKVIVKLLFPFADGCVFQTEEARAWFPKKLQKKSRIIYNAVKPEFFHTERNPVKYQIVTCGRLSEEKNHKMLIDAFKGVLTKYPYAELLIYGDGSLKSGIEKYLLKNGLQKNIFLKGKTDNVPKALSTADIFVLSSDFEGMPNALLEAMAMGIPCISTDCPCGGPKMVIKDGENGILVSVGDAKSMKNAILRLLDGDMKDSIGYKAKQSAARFAPDVVYKQWDNYILETVDNGDKNF